MLQVPPVCFYADFSLPSTILSLEFCIEGFCAVLQVLLSSSYKQKNDGFHKCFKQLPEAERLLVGENS